VWNKCEKSVKHMFRQNRKGMEHSLSNKVKNGKSWIKGELRIGLVAMYESLHS
jgi:hypothetical protein